MESDCGDVREDCRRGGVGRGRRWWAERVGGGGGAGKGGYAEKLGSG